MRPEGLDRGSLPWLWTAVLLGPIAWFISLSSMAWLTHPVCQGSTRAWLWATGAVCAAAAVADCIVVSVQLARLKFPPERAGIAPFLLRLAAGASAIFALVILLSLVPVAMLTPCPV